VTVKYRRNTFSKLIRKKQFDEIDFLSFVGGLLGLFAGFSSLSAVELLYWFVVSIFTKNCNQKTAIVHVQPFRPIEMRKSNILDDFIGSSSVHGLSYLKNTNLANR
jgi:hypothetical protein